jgi:hypothetical protein
MPNSYKIYPDINFGFAKLKAGKKSFKELYDLAELIRKDKEFSAVHYQLTDLRGCTFDFNQEKIDEMKALFEVYKDSDKQKVGVYIVDMPAETAMVHMFFNALGKNRIYCSTPEKAYELLNLELSFEAFISLINI